MDKINIKLIVKKAEISDIKDLFEWRNHSIARKNSFNTRKISWNEHKKWFNKKINDKNSTIYIVCDKENVKIGVTRFDEVENVIKINIMLNPEFIGKGFGEKIIKAGAKKFLQETNVTKPIIAEIKYDNIASIKSFKNAGFKENFLTYVYKNVK